MHISEIIVKVSNASLYPEERIADEKSIILIYVPNPMGAKESSQVLECQSGFSNGSIIVPVGP